MSNSFIPYSLFAPISHALRSRKFYKKLGALICNLSLVLNCFLPYLAAAAPAYAEEPTPTPSPTITETPAVEPTIEPTITANPTVEPTLEPTVVPTEEPTITPTVTAIEPTLVPEATPTPEITVAPSEDNNQSSDSNNNNSSGNNTSNSNNSSSTPTVAPSPTATPAPSFMAAAGEIDTTVVPNNSCRTDLLNPIIGTDKADYSPTEIAIITGHGFLPNTDYKLKITSDNLDQTYNIKSDSTGDFTYSYQLDGTYRPNYLVQIFDLSSVLISSVTFTDSVPGKIVVTKVVVGGPLSANSFTITGSGTCFNSPLSYSGSSLGQNYECKDSGNQTYNYNIAETPSTGYTVSYSSGCNGNITRNQTLLCTVTNTYISKSNQTITVNSHAPAKAIYGSSFPVAATASSGLVVAITVSGGCSVSGSTITMTSGTSDCVVHYNQSGNTSYNSAPEVTETVNAETKSLTITGISANNKVYDGSTSATISGTPSLLGVINSDSVTLGGTPVASFSNKNVGNPKTVTVSGYSLSGSKASNYSLTQPTLTAYITAKNLTITANSGQTKVYGTSDPVFTYTHSALISGDSLSGVLARVSGENVGVYVITQGTLTAGTNYSITFNSANFTITPASQTITFNSLSTKTYGDSPFTLSATATSGLPVSFSIVSGPATILGNTLTITGAGNVTVRASQSGDANYYAASNVDHSFTVNKVTPTIIWSDPVNIIYGTALSVTQLNAALSSVIAGHFSYNPNIGTFLHAGDNQPLSVTFYPTDSTNYNNVSKTVHINVKKALLTVTADPQSKVYGNFDPFFTYSFLGFVNGDDKYDLDLWPICTVLVPHFEVGNYPITCFLGGDNNYVFHYISDILSINPRPLTAHITVANKIYDGNVTATITSRSLSGIVDHDQVSLSGGIATFDTKDVGVGKIVTITGLTLTGHDAHNYSVGETTTATANITAKSITVTADPSQTKVYGDTDPVFTYTNDSLIVGDTLSGVLGRVSGEDVGIYAITQGTLSAGDNYSIGFTSADFTITQKTINVAADSFSKNVGDTDPVFTYTNDTLIGEDSFIGSLTRDPGEDAGTYAITQGSLTLGNNYILNFINGLLTINSVSTTTTTSTTSNAPGAAVCNDTAPTLAPANLRAVAGQNSVTLYWDKPNTSFTYYLIAFSDQASADKYGNPNIGVPDTLSYTVDHLSAGTTYYFKIRTGNGCAPGPFSTIVAATPGGQVLANAVPAGYQPGVLGVQTTENTAPLGTSTTNKCLPIFPFVFVLALIVNLIINRYRFITLFVSLVSLIFDYIINKYSCVKHPYFYLANLISFLLPFIIFYRKNKR